MIKIEKESPNLKELLEKYDLIAKDRHQSINNAPSGVGETFEHLLGIRRNNLPLPDYKGIEIKCSKKNEKGNSVDQDLFLKEPKWSKERRPEKIGQYQKKLIENHGKLDVNGRLGLYDKASKNKNTRGLYLKVNVVTNSIELHIHNSLIGIWKNDTLEKTLIKKFSHVVFIGAQASRQGVNELFRYESLIYCNSPSISSFIELVNNGKIWIELRMHIKTTGGIKIMGLNFGSRTLELEKLFDLHSKKR